MRRGEVLGLRWQDLDLDAGRLSVRQAVIEVAYVVDMSDVKTDNGRRTIDIDQGTVDVMKAWRIERAEERGGIDPRGDDLVFCKPDGSWIHPQSFSQVLDRKVATFLAAAGVSCTQRLGDITAGLAPAGEAEAVALLGGAR